jgi:Short C-terminal domain
MLGEHKHLQHTLRDHGGVTATAMVEQAHCLGTETSSGFHGTTYGYWFALKVAVRADGAQPFDASLRAFVHNYVSEGQTIPVIFDPDDHGKICMDTESVERERDTDREAASARLQSRIDAFKAAGAVTRETVIRGSEKADAFTVAEPEPGDEIEHLEQLAKLHATGALTDAEFAAAKAKLLGEAV